MSTKNHDRGMQAVARVREVRERDSRIGLLAALQTVRERDEQVAGLRAALEAAQQPREGTLDEFVVSRRLLASTAVAVREAEQRAESARTVAAEAQQRWQADKARLRAIRQLLQQRALQRADAVRRAEAKEVDDIVSALHARAQRASRVAALAGTHAARLAVAAQSVDTPPVSRAVTA